VQAVVAERSAFVKKLKELTSVYHSVDANDLDEATESIVKGEPRFIEYFLRGALCALSTSVSLSDEDEHVVTLEHGQLAMLDFVRRLCKIPASISCVLGTLRAEQQQHGEKEKLDDAEQHDKQKERNVRYRLRYKGTNAVDVLGEAFRSRLLSHSTRDLVDSVEAAAKPCLEKVFSSFVSMLSGPRSALPLLGIFKSDQQAVLPSKARVSDVGYDLTIVKLHKRLSAETALYNTGIRLSIPSGYYVEVVPRSSLSKSGFMLTNSIGIIDPGYTGDILVALTCVSPGADLSPALPFKCCQLILRRQEHAVIREISPTAHRAAATQRGVGGFGSTD
jgi:deoxyuridine 5'-triphosphate nucleotidohydrolase